MEIGLIQTQTPPVPQMSSSQSGESSGSAQGSGAVESNWAKAPLPAYAGKLIDIQG
jgi:hypothetical protein